MEVYSYKEQVKMIAVNGTRPGYSSDEAYVSKQEHSEEKSKWVGGKKVYSYKE